MNRRSFLGAALGVGAASFGWATVVEARWLAVRRVSVRVPGLERTVRLLHLSDLHASPVVPESLIEESIGTAARLRPDLICVTGDFVTSRGGFREDWFVRALRGLAQVAPTYATMGNHDGGEWASSHVGHGDSTHVRQLVQAAGIGPLHNARALVSGLELVGLGDLWAGEFRPRAAFPATDAGLPRVVLSHNPDTKLALGEFRWDVMLSGHTHGGQVVVPVVGSPWAPVADHRYLSGLKRWRDRWIHVSTGVGSAGGIRLNCRPEVTALDLLAPEPGLPG